MRKEYIPAMIIYGISAVFFILAVISALTKGGTDWVNFVCLGVLWLAVASSRLVDAGRRIRQQEQKDENPTDNGDE